MKTTLPKKSQEHQEIINGIAEIIKEVGKKKITHIILFGSFARGDFLDDEIKQESDGSWLQYISDYDFLIITSSNKPVIGQSAINLEKKIQEKVEKNLLDKQRPVSLIIEPLARINKELKNGQYFFSDIKKEGILLYEAENAKELSTPKELTNEEKRVIAQDDYDYWFDSALEFLIDCKNALKRKNYRKSAFYLHQATENLYCCSHLVFTNYRPKLHNIEKLNKPLIYHAKEFLNIFPQDTEEEKECFDLLKRAYVEARYNKNYSITKEQLEYLIVKVENLKKIVEIVCENKINSFRQT